MSSERYEILQDDLDSLLERIEASLEWVAKKTNSINEQKSGLTRCLSQLEEARSYLKEMDQEARSAPLAYRYGQFGVKKHFLLITLCRSEMLSKVRGYREIVGKLQSDIRQREFQMTKDRLRGTGDDDMIIQQSHEEMLRQQVMRGTAVLERTTESIQRSQQVAHETAEVGEAIMGDLGVQRETLERARSMLHETDAELSRSRRILKRISRGTLYNKVIAT